MEHPKHILSTLGIRPRKKWGQNFLMYENNVQSLLRFANIAKGANILEIGPGLGAMTQSLISTAKQYKAVEYDPILFRYLNDHFTQAHVEIICDDILDFSFENLFDGQPYQVIGNLPYHITTLIIEKLIDHRSSIESMTFLLQKEVVSRMISPANTKVYGRLSVWLQSLCTLEKGPVLKPTCFYPAPDVDSQAIKLIPKQNELPDAFFELVKHLFQKRRKTLAHTLKALGYTIEKLDTSVVRKRPENLTPEEFLDLFETLTQ